MGAAGVGVGILANLIARDKKFDDKKKELDSGQISTADTEPEDKRTFL